MPVFRRKCDQISKEFSFRDGNLFLLAMDEAEPRRVRIIISAQRDKNTGTYDGQIFVDMGGNQLMPENDVRRGREGTQPRAQLVSGASRKRMFFDQRDHFGDFAEYLFRGMAAGDPDVVIPNPFAVSESLRLPERHALASAIYRFFCRMKSSMLDSLPCPASSERMPLSISARNARSFSTCESKVRPICS